MQVGEPPLPVHLLENRNAEVDQYFNSHDIVHSIGLTQKMVCKPDLDEEEEAFCVVRDFSGTSQNMKVHLKAPPTMTGKEFVYEVAKMFNFEPCSFRLVSPSPSKKDNTYQAVLTEDSEELLKDVGVNFETNNRNLFIVEGLNCGNPKLVGKEDDLEVGASASPEESAVSTSDSPTLPIMSTMIDFTNDREKQDRWRRCSNSDRSVQTGSQSDIGFRGLVNQAMTCYLNSLLQALFMTPEFRNALYNWKFNKCLGADESKSIPYQLQRLFLNLQTSPRRAVETTDLTRSFGWDSSEAWQQHDIQELCRVMFDALEQEFKGTEQADLINRLYEGKMMDYVKCLDCGTEKSREDTFLDIPLPVRPFGTNVAYGSVEEALRAFVQPEVLDDNNQYFCEKCNKKCNAHKGLKFIKFPYLLTLHLLRFDFDYNTMHRIKLGDKVVFPEILNLNSFVPAANLSTTNLFNEDGSEGIPEEITGSSSKCDDSSTTDSGSVDYDQDIDEGIDVSNQHENEKNRNHGLETGPYVYDLFAIMVHSGSASGGHYYVYIKDFNTNDWFCFNDQTVTRITHEDIDRSFGGYGGPSRGYYPGVYSSSINAYMLMYRQIDRERNVLPLRKDEFPSHIKALLKEMDDKAESERRTRELERETYKIRIFVHQPTLDKMIEAKVECKSYTSLKEVIQVAYNKLQLDSVVPVDLCRLVLYNSQTDTVECSFDGKENERISSLLLGPPSSRKIEMLMEIRKPNENFSNYRNEAVPIKLNAVDIETETIRDPVSMRVSLDNSVSSFRNDLYEKFKPSQSPMLFVFLDVKSEAVKCLEDETVDLRTAGVTVNSRIFFAFTKDEISVSGCRQKIRKIVMRYFNIIKLTIELPNVNEEICEVLSIPSLSDYDKKNSSENNLANVMTNNDVSSVSGDKGDEGGVVILLNGGGNASTNNASISSSSSSPMTNGTSSKLLTVDTSYTLNEANESCRSDQSASEDSSLTDSDRTIVGENVEDYQISSRSSSPRENNIRYPVESFGDEEAGQENSSKLVNECDTEECSNNASQCDYYFKELSNNAAGDNRNLRIEVDKCIPSSELKRLLEPYVHVDSPYFNLIKEAGNSSCSPPTKIYSLRDMADESRLQIQLTSLPMPGHFKGTLYVFDLRFSNRFKFGLETYIDSEMNVGETKLKFIRELHVLKNMFLPPESCQLRCKVVNHGPGEIYREKSTWKELKLDDNWEMYIHRVHDSNVVVNPSVHCSLLIRRFLPSADIAECIRDFFLEEINVELMKQKISDVSSVPVENIVLGEQSWTKAFNADKYCVEACICNYEIDWNPQNSFKSPEEWLKIRAKGGFIIFYKDDREKEIKTSRRIPRNKPGTREVRLRIRQY